MLGARGATGASPEPDAGALGAELSAAGRGDAGRGDVGLGNAGMGSVGLGAAGLGDAGVVGALAGE